MTTRLRFEDFEAEGGRLDLGGRVVFADDILSIQLQRRVSAALLGYVSIGALLLFLLTKTHTEAALLSVLGLCVLIGFGIRHEWRRPYVLTLVIYQLGRFEVYGIPPSALPALQEHFGL